MASGPDRRRQALQAPFHGLDVILAFGAPTGVVTVLVLRPHLGGDLFRVVLTPVQGVVLGGASAVWFWWLWTRGNPKPG